MRVGAPIEMKVEILSERILARESGHSTGNFAGDPQLENSPAGVAYMKTSKTEFIDCSTLTPEEETGIGRFTDDQMSLTIK